MDSQAAGWCHAAELRDDGIWAQIDWTDTARDKIAAREYRFISPEFQTHISTSEILTLDAISLVNRPAFTMAAIAAAQIATAKTPEEQSMKNIAAALGLPEDATEETILAKINEGKTELASARLTGLMDVLPIVAFILLYVFAASRDYFGARPLVAALVTAGFVPYAAATVPLFSTIPASAPRPAMRRCRC